jgi:nucleoside-diphosphate-sugar epimerase
MIANNTRQQVGIIGCGWLGCALAKELLRLNNDVTVTTTTLVKQPELTRIGLQNELLTLPDDSSTLASLNVFKQQQLVICIPPQLKHGSENYVDNIKTLVSAANNGDIQQLILISTTAIYRGLSGEVNESSPLETTDKKVKALLLAEEQLKNFNGNSCIIRFAGLVGGDRHPGNFLTGKTQLTNGEASVNVIHQQDSVGIILSLLTSMNETSHQSIQVKPAHQKATKQETNIFNGVSCTHPCRKIFYQQASKALNLAPPQFDDSRSLIDTKVVSGKKIQDKLNYQFVYPDLLAWLAET